MIPFGLILHTAWDGALPPPLFPAIFF